MLKTTGITKEKDCDECVQDAMSLQSFLFRYGAIGASRMRVKW